MKIYKIQQLLMQQELHDKEYHKDIYYKSTNDKLLHFSLHYSKYFSRIVLNDYVPLILMVDTLLITLSLINTLTCYVDDVDLQKGISSKNNLIKSYAVAVEKIAKALDSQDHLENYSIRSTLEEVPNLFLILIQNYISQNNIENFEEQILKRYQTIRNKRLY